MRILRMLALAALTLATPVSAQQADTLSLIVCNNSDHQARVAVQGYNGAWTIEGWWVVFPGECKAIAYVQRGTDADLYAETFDSRTKWGAYRGGFPVNLCLPTSGERFLYYSTARQCAPHERLRAAIRYRMDSSENTWTWTLNNDN